MSATIVAVKPGGWGGQAQSKDWIRRYSLVYTIRTDDPGDGPMIVGDCPGLPPRGAWYQFGNERDVGAILKTRTVKQVNNQKHWWEVADSYDSQQDDEDPEDPEENPLLRPPKRRIGFERRDRVAFQDLDEKKFVNSAGEPYDASVATIPKSLLVLTISRNEAALPTAIARGYQNCTNEYAFYGYGADQALMQDIGADDGWENGVYFWACFYKIVFDPDGWVPEKQLDKGTYYWAGTPPDVGVASQKRFFSDGTGVVSSSESHLDAQGGKLSEVDLAAGEFNFIEFRKHDRKDFNALDLEW